MKRIYRETSLLVGKLNRRHVQLFLLVLTLSLFILGAGAPGAEGTTTGL